MSYQTGPSTSPVALLDSFVAFLIAVGWVQDQYTAEGTGKRAHLHKGTKYVHMRSFINENDQYLGAGAGLFGSGIAIIPATGYAVPPINWYVQPGAPVQFGGVAGPNNWTGVMPLPAGAIQNYWMFADAAGDNVWLVALKQSGVYTYLGFGDIIKPQAYTGGFWCCFPRYAPLTAFTAGEGVTTQSDAPGSNQGFFKADVDSWVGKWNSLTNGVSSFGSQTIGKRVNSSTGLAVAADHIRSNAFRIRSRSERTGALMLQPTLWLVERDFGGAINGGGWSGVGRIPDVYATSTVGFVPGTQYDIATDQYIVFPDFVVRKYP